MADQSRLDDLRRRVEKDPASIAFAQLAEEYRRAGQIEQAVQVCRAGLDIHPGYLSARVTLGRALVELNQLDDAQHELEQVLHSAPENLAAIRGLAEIHHRRGHLGEALEQYRAALTLARNDPDLERTVEELARKVAPQPRAEPANGLSFDQMHAELLGQTPGAKPVAPGPPVAAATSESLYRAPQTAGTAENMSEGTAGAQTSAAEPVAAIPAPAATAVAAMPDGPTSAAAPVAAIEPAPAALMMEIESAPAARMNEVRPALMAAALSPVSRVESGRSWGAAPAFIAPVAAAAPEYNVAIDATRARAHRTIAALEQWLDALNVSRTHSGA